jgi:hypothetical protein
MNAFVRILLSAFLSVGAFAVQGQDAPPMSPGFHEPRAPLRELSPEEREQWRQTRRERRDAWRQMSPEERHQLRRDIRDAGHAIYPRGMRSRDQRKD